MVRTRRAGAGPEAPVPREGVKLRAEPNLPRHRVVMLDQRPGIVQKHLRGHTAELSSDLPSWVGALYAVLLQELLR